MASLLYSRSTTTATDCRSPRQKGKCMLESAARRRPSSEVLLNAARIVGDELEISWVDASSPGRFSPLWLRDHCHSKESLNPDTLQRQVDTFAIPADITPAQVEIGGGGKELRIVWRQGGDASVLPATFLWNMMQDGGRERAPPRRLWDRAAMGEDFPSVRHGEI